MKLNKIFNFLTGDKPIPKTKPIMKISINEINRIKEICEKYKIENYTINDDGTVDVDGDVKLSNRLLTKLPLKFGKVTGDFNCGYNKLISLEGAPKYVGGSFRCEWSYLNTLFYSPEYVGCSFDCSYNYITKLIYGPKYVGGDYDCHHNKITTLKGIPDKIHYLICYENDIKNIDHLPKHYTALSIHCNPIYQIIKSFIPLKQYRDYYHPPISEIELKDSLSDFNDREIIQNDILILDRLVEFLDDLSEPLTYSRRELNILYRNNYETR